MSSTLCGAVKFWAAEGGIWVRWWGPCEQGSSLSHQARQLPGCYAGRTSHSHHPFCSSFPPAHFTEGKPRPVRTVPTIAAGHHQPDGVKVGDVEVTKPAPRLLQCEGRLGAFPCQGATGEPGHIADALWGQRGQREETQQDKQAPIAQNEGLECVSALGTQSEGGGGAFPGAFPGFSGGLPGNSMPMGHG